MKGLDKHQIKTLEQALTARKIQNPLGRVEFFDHISSMIEHEIARGHSFKAALKQVMHAYSDRELDELAGNARDSKAKETYILAKKRANALGIMLGVLTCLWVYMEYVIGNITGVRELGALYGLISEIILVTVLLVGTRRFIRAVPQNISFGALLTYNLRIAIIGALIVFFFMVVYGKFINPNLYGILEIEAPRPDGSMAWIVAGSMSMAVMIQGLIVALLVGAFNRKSRLAKA